MPGAGDDPALRSLALEGDGRFDYADVILVARPPGTPDDPRTWAETLFSRASMPAWVRAAMVVRGALAPLLGLAGAPRGVFDVREVRGDEALLEFVDGHLTFRCAVGVDARHVRVTTVVVFNDWRGRVYFTPVSIAHPVVVGAMLKRCRRVLAARPTRRG